jgi:hypothetical protein
MVKKGRDHAASEASDASSGANEQAPKVPKTGGGMDTEEPSDRVGGVQTPLAQSSGTPDLNAMMKIITDGFAKMDHGMTAQGKQLATLTDNFAAFKSDTQQRLTDMENRIAQQAADFEEKIAAIRSSSTTPLMFPPAIASESAAGGSSRPTLSGMAARRPAPPTSRARSAPAARIDNTTRDKYKALALGFPRELPRAAFLAHFKHIGSEAPDGLFVDTECHAGNAKAYAISFPSQVSLRRFLRWTKDNEPLTGWTDPRNTKLNHRIYFKAIKTEEDQLRGRALAPLYKVVEEAIEKDVDDKIFPEDADLIADTAKGRLFIKTPVDMWILAETDGDKVTINYEVLDSFGITKDMLKAPAAPANRT